MGHQTSPRSTHRLGKTLWIQGPNPGDNLRTNRGRTGDDLRVRWGHLGDHGGDLLGMAWGHPRSTGRMGARTGGAIHRFEKDPEGSGPRLRTTRGQPGDIVRTACGGRFVILRRARSVHLACTSPVDGDTRSHLGERPMSTLSTAPITSTALSLYPRRNSTQVRAWGSSARGASLEHFHPTLNPKPAGGGSP